MSPTISSLAGALILALAAGTASAQQSYRCVDKAGKAVYTERPCEAAGLKTEKTIKDMPKGVGVAPAPGSRPAERSTTTSVGRNTGPDQRSIMCGDKPVRCERGTVLTCNGASVRCEGD